MEFVSFLLFLGFFFETVELSVLLEFVEAEETEHGLFSSISVFNCKQKEL